MFRLFSISLQRTSNSFRILTNTSPLKTLTPTLDHLIHEHNQRHKPDVLGRHYHGTASSPSLSIWRRKKEMSKEGMFVVKELKRLKSDAIRFDRFVRTHVSRLLKSDLFAVLAEFQRQDQVFLCMKAIKDVGRVHRYMEFSNVWLSMSYKTHGTLRNNLKIYDVVRKEIWYRPDMFFYRDMLMMLARNKDVDRAKRVWEDLRREEVLFDQHTYGDIVRSFLDNGLPDEAMDLYEEMRRSPDPPLSLPYRVMLKGLLPYPELRDKVKSDFLELFPDMIIYDPPEDLFDGEKLTTESEDD